MSYYSSSPMPESPAPVDTPTPTPTPAPTPSDLDAPVDPSSEAIGALVDVSGSNLSLAIGSPGLSDLLSTAVPSGLSDPYSPDRGGGGSPQLDSYTGVSRANDNQNQNSSTTGGGTVDTSQWVAFDDSAKTLSGYPGLDSTVSQIMRDLANAAAPNAAPEVASDAPQIVYRGEIPWGTVEVPASWQTPPTATNTPAFTESAQLIAPAPPANTPAPPPSPPPDPPLPPSGGTQTIANPQGNPLVIPGPAIDFQQLPSGALFAPTGGGENGLGPVIVLPEQVISVPSPTSTVSQIFSGTYADSVLERQLSGQGLVPGSFVNPTLPHDYLFNPNATNLMDATLLSSHSPNRDWLDAQSMQLGVSMAPVVGSVATWMNPHSGWFAKGMAVAGVLPIVSELGGLASVSELGSLSTEATELEAIEQHHIFPQAQDLKAQFQAAGIDIDEWALEIPESVHDQLHGSGDLEGVGSGGIWNENWRQFFSDPQFATAPPTAEQIWEQAFKMIVGFDLSEYLPTVQYLKKGW
jgi:hypothetical protein